MGSNGGQELRASEWCQVVVELNIQPIESIKKRKQDIQTSPTK